MAEQKVKTKEYWDKFYKTNPTSIGGGDSKSTDTDVHNKQVDGDGDESNASDLEWIVPNAPQLLDKILDLFPSWPPKEGYDDIINVLEIGCGVSQISKSLLQRIVHKQETPSVHRVHKQSYNFVSTDISSVCIDHNRIRDDVFISSLHATNDGNSLSYEVLDVLNKTTCISHAQNQKQYSVILDKGTLDTFLFRSKRTKKGSSSHPPILTVLLNNIHCLLSSDGIYLIISPRSKIRSLRDFQGFTSVCRIAVDVTTFDGSVVLVKGNSENAKQQPKSEVYLYQCIKNDKYSPARDEPYNTNLKCKAEDCSTCGKCGMSFKQFRGKVEVKDQGEVVWKRRFNNHIVHCKGII